MRYISLFIDFILALIPQFPSTASALDLLEQILETACIL